MIRRAQLINRCRSLLQSLFTTIHGSAFYAAGHVGDALDVFCQPSQ